MPRRSLMSPPSPPLRTLAQTKTILTPVTLLSQWGASPWWCKSFSFTSPLTFTSRVLVGKTVLCQPLVFFCFLFKRSDLILGTSVYFALSSDFFQLPLTHLALALPEYLFFHLIRIFLWSLCLSLPPMSTDFSSLILCPGRGFLKFLAKATLALELGGPFLLVSPFFSSHLRLVVVFLFWGLHLGFGLTLRIGTQSPLPPFCIKNINQSSLP